MNANKQKRDHWKGPYKNKSNLKVQEMGWEPWSNGYRIHSSSVDRGFTDDGCPDVMLV